MRFSVRHQTRYLYSEPVRLGAHVLRFNPRPDAGRLLSRTLSLEPTPDARQEWPGAFGNLITRVAFAGETDSFVIDRRFELEVVAPPLCEASSPPPLPWPAEADGSNAVCCSRNDVDETVRAFAAELAGQCGGDALALLDRLNERLFVDIRHDIRDEGAARPAAATLARGHGACRDVTNLFLAACRRLGAPARFVSGYQAKADTPDGRRHLHVWPEVFTPVIGWRAYDPTHGVTVATPMLRSAPALRRRRPCRSKADTMALRRRRSIAKSKLKPTRPDRRRVASRRPPRRLGAEVGRNLR